MRLEGILYRRGVGGDLRKPVLKKGVMAQDRCKKLESWGTAIRVQGEEGGRK